MTGDYCQTIIVNREYVEKYHIGAFIKAAEEYKTAGIRGTIGKTLEEGKINTGSIRLYAQARANYIRTHYPVEQQAIFIGWDERLFSSKFALELAWVYAGNGIKVYMAKQSMPCPITSYTGWYYGISADLITASHNPATKMLYYNGVKPSSDSGGLVSEDETNEIIRNMKAIYEATGVIKLTIPDFSLIQKIDPLPTYMEHLENNLPSEDIANIKQAGRDGFIKACWGTYGGAAGPALERINAELLGNDWDKYIQRLHWEVDPYFHGYGDKADPSDELSLKEMLEKEGPWEQMIKGNISFVQATDGDGDRIGVFCRCPRERISEAQKKGLAIYNLEGKPYGKMDHQQCKEGIACIAPYQIHTVLMVARMRKLISAGEDLSQYVIVTSHSTPYFDRIAKYYGCKLLMVPVGFKWLNLAASQIEAGHERIEIEEIHWRGEHETLHHHIGKVKGIIGICEESGGGNLGNINEEENRIGQKSKVAKEKDALKVFLLNQAEASRLALEGKTLVDAYLDILAQPELGSSYFHRTDLPLDAHLGQPLKEAFMDYYTELYWKYKNHPRGLQVGKTKAEKIFRAGDGVKIIFENESWLYVRPSGTEPKLKIFSWGKNKEEQESLEKASLMVKHKCTRRVRV